MRKSTTHFKDVSRLLSTSVDSGKSSVIPNSTCRRNSHLRALLHAFPPLEQQQQPHRHLFIPKNSSNSQSSHHNNRRSTLIRSMSTSSSAATIEKLPMTLPPVSTTTTTTTNTVTGTLTKVSITATATAAATKKCTATTTNSSTRLHGSFNLFNLSDRVGLADLDYAIQTRNADKAWSLFITLVSRQQPHESDNVIPFTLCCSLYALLNFAKRLAGGNKKQASKLRQRQLDQLLDYVLHKNTYNKSIFLSSIQHIPISSHKQLLKAIRMGDQKEAWHLFYKLHQANSTTKLPRNTCIKLMIFMMKDKSLDKNQRKMRLQLIALHGAGTSEFDDRFLSAADVLRITNISYGYQQQQKTTAHGLIDEFVQGILKKKQAIRADALDELVWRILVNGDIQKAHQILDTIQANYSDKVEINEMIYVNLMNGYRRQKKYHEALKLFEQLLVERTKTPPTIKAFNAILQIFAAQGSADRASYIFESMAELGVIPDTASYTELIRAHVHSGHIKTCIYYYNKMLQHNLTPNVYTYSALIEASARRNDIKSVLKWFQVMLDQDVQPNQVVISCILKSLSKQHVEYPNMPEAVIQIAHQAIMAGIKTDAALYTILLKMQADAMGLEGALKIHRDMLSQSVEPNTYTYTILMDACGKNRMPETAQKIFDLMQKSKKHLPNTVTYTVLMDAWSMVDRKDQVESLMVEFLKACKSDKSGRLWLDTRIRERLKSRCC